MTVSRSMRFFAVIGLLAATGGCDGESTEDPCEGLAGLCEVSGAARCDGDAVETCAEDGHGCHVWTVTATCGRGQACVEGGGTARCECEHECAVAGVTSCEGEEVVACVEGGDGCRVTVTTLDCSDLGASCVDTSGSAECVVPPCEDECGTEGATACEGDAIVSCERAADGCLDFVTRIDCSAGGAQCDDESGTPACVIPPGCGPCDAPGELCDTSVDPPECVVAGTIPEILEGVEVGAGWADLDAQTRAALRARAELTHAEYRAAFGPEALAAAVATMLGTPTAAMEANFTAFLEAVFAVDDVASLELDRILRNLYVLFLFAHQGLAINYQFVPPVTWDGVTSITWFPSPEPESLVAYRDLGARMAAACQVLRRDLSTALTGEDRRVLEAATSLARRLRVGDLGYFFGDRTLSQVPSLLGWGWDFMLNYHEWGGAIFEDDDAFLDQVNAYYFAELVRVHEGTVPALEFQHAGAFDEYYVDMLIGPPAESRTAQLYIILGGLFRDRVLAHPDISTECYPYGPEELASIWDGFTADQLADNDGLTTIASFREQLRDVTAGRLARAETRMTDALLALFPADGAAMTVAERDAIVAAVEAADSPVDALEAFYGGLAAAGDGSAPTVLDAALAGLTQLFGRDYADVDHGAAWLAEDEATAQAMWDEVRAWVLGEYGLAPALLSEDLVVSTEEDSFVIGPAVTVGLATRASLATWYVHLLRMASRAVSDASGSSWAGTPAIGFVLALEATGVNDRFYAATLPAEDLAELPLYYLPGPDGACAIGSCESDAALGQYLGECGPDGVVDWLRDDVLAGWGVPEGDDRDLSIAFIMLGPWLVQYEYTEIIYTDIFAAFQERLDAEHGAGAHRADPFVLQACGLFDPRPDDATYEALESCLGL